MNIEVTTDNNTIAIGPITTNDPIKDILDALILRIQQVHVQSQLRGDHQWCVACEEKWPCRTVQEAGFLMTLRKNLIHPPQTQIILIN